MAASPAFAASGTNYEVEVGKTLRLDISDWGVECMANGSSYTWEITSPYVGGPSGSDYLTITSKFKNYAIVKGLKAGKLIGIQYTGYYYSNGVRREFYDVFYVRVISPTVTNVSIQPTLTLEVGATATLTPTVTPSGAETSYSWTSDNICVASVSQCGLVTGKNVGITNVRVKTDNGKTATCEVIVVTPKLKEYEVSYRVYNNGKVIRNCSTLTGCGSFKVAEGSDVAFTIIPDDGYKVEWLWIDYKEVDDQLVNNVLTVRNIKKDIYLVASFEKDEQKPEEKPVVTSENALELGMVTANTGTMVPFPVSLTNKDAITAIQMDLHLPEGITLVTDENALTFESGCRFSNKHIVDCNRIDNNSYRIVCFSTTNTPFAGNSGLLFNVMLNVGKDVRDGDYEIKATNIELSDNTGTAHTGQDVKGKVTVKSYLLGDADNNGKHTINDAVCIINHILNHSNAMFVEAAADLDGNGKITVNDAVLLISKYILGNTANARTATRAAEVSNEVNFMSIEDVTMQPGEVKTIEVMMTNEREDIKGVQCDITLPRGVSFLYDEDAEDYVSASSRVPKKLAFSSEMQDENTLRVAGVCTGSSSIYGNTGSVFTFKVKADENIETGIYEIQLTNVELSYGEAIDVADRSSALEILKGASGIAAIASDECSKSGIYDLNGRRVDAFKAKKGIFIVNGKKVLIK
jgi:hypothetical protein